MAVAGVTTKLSSLLTYGKSAVSISAGNSQKIHNVEMFKASV